MASLSAEEQVKFLIQTFATCKEFVPDYPALAKVMGIERPHNAQRRFKGIIEANKTFILKCEKGATSVVAVDADDEDNPVTSTTETPKSRGKGKGRKRVNPEDENDEPDVTPSNPPKKKSKQVEPETENEDEVADNEEVAYTVEEEAI